uniref:Uncharacterized protein n=1 Tax=Panagrolaimus davidi TaxID=227884 RepID=A0A914PBN0_9BILA
MDDNCVPLEDILEVVPNIKQLDIDTNANSFVSHQNAVQKVPSSLKKIYLLHIEKDFNFEECFKFIQNRQEIELEFRCGRDWPNEVVKSVQQLTDTLIDAFLPQFKPPSIYFKGQSKKSRKNLRILKYSYEKKEKNDKKNEGTF